MKPANIDNTIGSDRLATWSEVICAISVSSHGAVAPVRACDDLRRTDSDCKGSAWNLPEVEMWLAIVSELPESESN